jgi:GNAT superfamily N-acetyltransferase
VTGRTAPFKVPGYKINYLGSKNKSALQQLLERCSDYSLLVTGESPKPTAARMLLADVPPGVAPRSKLVIGIFDQDKLIGVLDCVRDYPSSNDWWLGLLLIDPAFRGRGLGGMVYRDFEKWIKQQGANRIFLGVIKANQKAFQFWLAMNFLVGEEQPPRRMGVLQQVVIEMGKELK